VSDRKGTLWIDVTMLVNWSGHLTGIQRVEYNIAKRYAGRKNVKFCVFHKPQRKLTEFDFNHITYKIEMLQSSRHAAPSGDIDQTNTKVFRKRLQSKVKQVIAPILPEKSKAYLRRYYQRVQGSRTISDEPPVTLHKNDTLLILSGDWSDTTFADLVAEIRTESQCNVIQIIYDMLPAIHPAYFVPGMPEQFSTYMQQILPNCDCVLAISESTKNDIETFMNAHALGKVPIHVFRLGDDFVKQTAIRPDIEVEAGRYLLCVCTVEARKNHLLLYYAAREAISRGVSIPPIVLVGRKGWLVNDLFYLIENDPVLKRVFIFAPCSDQELAWLYQNCMLTVFPSFYEGWGLPVAESLFYGKYCLSSNSSSMPEIAGNLIEYFSPNDPMTLLEKILYFEGHPDALAENEKSIKNEYKPTSWDESFSHIDEIMHEYLG
jgi:glycosyltransferase involved in cell wall biosynthesis